MAKGDLYKNFNLYLSTKNDDKLVLSFQEIEKILNRSLPPSAYIHKAWWSNDSTHSQAISWLEGGYKTTMVSDTFVKNKIIFEKKP